MPLDMECTYIQDIALIDYKNLTKEEIALDTETMAGEFYPLPKTKLIWIKLRSVFADGWQDWGTMRRHTPAKFKYYSGLVGEQVRIEIAPQAQY